MSLHVAPDAYTRFVPPMVVRHLQETPTTPLAPHATRFRGAVMFADVSGFTPLTEYLAHRGPDGAEQLTRILNDYFSQLVDIVSHYGGEVVKFAGDALVVVWPAPEDTDDHLAQATRLAAQSGLDAQQRLHNYSVLDGRQLSLHVGIGAGDVYGMHVGGSASKWEFTLAGPALQQMSDAEHLSAPGTVVLSPQAWNLVHQDAVADTLESGFALLRRLRSPTQAPDKPAALHLDSASIPALAAYLPDVVRTRLEASQTEWMAELRRITVLFVNVLGLDYTAPDSLVVVQQMVSAVQRVLFHYEASINQLLVDDKGTVIVAALGLPPLGHEDDAVRGVNAAVALASVLRDLELRSAVGVATGLVFCGPVGSPVRSTYTIMGDTVNTAARLMQHAVDDILCDAATRDRAGVRLHFDTLAPLALKGKQEPVPVFRPHGKSLLSQRLQPMFGRTSERAQLGQLVDALKQGQATSVVLLEGEAGMGKSRLVSELMQQARGDELTCLVGAADAVEQTTPYLAYRSVFRHVFNVDGAEDVPRRVQERAAAWFSGTETSWLRLLPLLNDVLDLDFPDNEHTSALTGRTRAANTQRLLVKLLQLLSESRPVLLLVEDGHWLDSASWALTCRIAQEVSPLLLVVAHRPLEAAPEEFGLLAEADGTVRLRLQALSQEETLALLCARLGVATLPDAVASFILKRGSGSPFFTEELAYALRDAAAIQIVDRECRLAPGVDSLEHVQIPDTVQGIITSRIDRLPPVQQLMLKAASVIGRVFGFDILRDIYPVAADRDTMPEHMDTILHNHFVMIESPPPTLGYIFSHVITQEVAYGQMLFAQRRQLHRAVAEWHEQHQTDNLESFYPLLAHHWSMAEDAPKTLEYLEKAGEQALRRGAYREARSFLESALQRECPDTRRRARQTRLLGEAKLGLGEALEGRVCLERALEVLGLPVPRMSPRLLTTLTFEVLRQIAHRCWPDYFSNRQAALRETYLEGVRAYERLVEAYYLDEQQVPTMFSAIRGLNMAEEIGPSPELARLYANMCIAMGLVPWSVAAERYAWRGQVVARQLKQLEVTGWVWQLIGLHALGSGELLRAEQYLEHASATFEQLGDGRHWDESTCLLAERHLYQGRFPQACDTYEKVIKGARHSGDQEGLLWCLTGRGYCLTLMGQAPAEALALYQEALKLLEGGSLGQLEHILCHGEMSFFHLLRGELDDARRCADLTLPTVIHKPPTSLSGFEGRAALAETCVRLWEAERSEGSAAMPGASRQRALQAAASLRRFARVFPIAHARALTFTGMTEWLQGRHRAAFAGWWRSLAAAEGLDLLYDQALAHREIGRHLAPDHRDRMAHLERADELFGYCSARCYLDGALRLR